MHARNQLLERFLSASTDETADFLPISSEVCPNFLCSIDVRWAIQVWLLGRKEGDDAQQDGLDGVHGHPSFPRVLIAVLIVAGRVKDRYTHAAIRIDIRVPHRGDKAHLGRQKRELGREGQSCFEKATLVDSISRADYHDVPFVEIVLINKPGRKALDRMLGQLCELTTKQESV